RWNNDVAEPQGREENLAEGADIDHARIGIESLQRSNGQALVSEFAVVVVFNDPGARVLRPLYQLQPARSAHRNSQRKLMRRTDEGGAGARGGAHSGGNIKTFRVHWNGHRTSPIENENIACEAIAGLFQPYATARIYENTGGDFKCMLRTID